MEVVSDNGPQFACASFRDFAKEWDFIHTTSSPRYPQSNGEAERFVQTVNDMFMKAEHGNSDIYVSLKEYRASPIDGVRLSQLLMNRQLKTKLPVSSELLKPEVVKSKQKELVERQKSQKFYYEKKSKPLPKSHREKLCDSERTLV
jgi:transposase InsO family protein